MQDYLKIVRLRNPVYDQPAPIMSDTSEDGIGLVQRLLSGFQSVSIAESSGEHEYEYHGAYNNRFLTNGYAQLLGINMVVFLYLGLAVVVIWAICELKDLIVRKVLLRN
mgnify:CR=1 FL=1